MLLFSPWHDPLSCQSHSCATGFGSRRVSAISNTVLAVDCSGARPGYPSGDARKPNQAPLLWAHRPHPRCVATSCPVCRVLVPGASPPSASAHAGIKHRTRATVLSGGWLAVG